MDLQKLIDERSAAYEAARKLYEAAEKDNRALTEDEETEKETFVTKAEDLNTRIKQAKDAEDLRKQILEIAGEGGLEPVQPAAGGGKVRGKTFGATYLSSPEHTKWMKQVAPSGEISEGTRLGDSPPVEVKTIPGLFGRKELITEGAVTSAGAFIETDYTGIYEPIGRYPLMLRQLIAVRQTDSMVVSFVRQTAQVTQAAPVLESNVTEFSGSTGEVEGVKPEGTSRWEEVQQVVQEIAAWLPVTKRSLADVPQMRGLLDQELRDDLAEELENQIMNGTGIGANFTGLLNTPGILAQAWTTDILTTMRMAITTLLVTGRTVPTAWLLHPQDWETIDLETDLNGQYHFGGPVREGTRTVWGYPVAQCIHVPQGTAILGNWRKAVLWDRERTTIQISDSHADFFIRNLVAVRASMRATFALTSPDSFVQVDLTAGS